MFLSRYFANNVSPSTVCKNPLPEGDVPVNTTMPSKIPESESVSNKDILKPMGSCPSKLQSIHSQLCFCICSCQDHLQ